MKSPLSISDSVFDVLIGGKSILDAKNDFVGQFDQIEEVDRYLEAYGFSVDDPVEMAELMGHIQEAIRFIQNTFLKPANPDGLDLEIPKKILELVEPRELLVMTSKEIHSPYLRAWACAVLKVVHTLSHMDRDVRNYYFTDIQKQILDRFYKAIHRTETGQLYLGKNENDPGRVDLVAFDVKPKKARESTLVKLLQKPESVAEELFDRVGIRFITRTRVDAVRAIDFLEKQRIVVAANIKPSRSRNSLIDVAKFKTLTAQGEELDQVEQQLVTSNSEDVAAENNVHSSKFYRSIQFTCRQLIKISNPLVGQIRSVRTLTKNLSVNVPTELSDSIERLDPTSLPRMVRFFYPFEIQVVDQVSHEENEKGRSAHSEYKKAQLMTAMQRVMQGVMRVRES